MNFRPDVRYRIQSVDFGTFLERRSISDSNLYLRAQNESDLRQLWYFVEATGRKGVYEIQNADDREICITLIDKVVKDGDQTVTSEKLLGNGSRTDANSDKLWKIPRVPGKPAFYLVNVSHGIGPDTNPMLCAETGFSLTIKKEKIEDIDMIAKPEQYRWKILEASPASLPDGDGHYRIRALNGYIVQAATVNGHKSLSAVQNQNDHNQPASWEIKDEGNGHCAIKNIHDNTYLCAEKYGGNWVPGFTKTHTKETLTTWIIKATTDFTHSICIRLVSDPGRPTAETSMSLSIDGKKVILKPMKVAHNQPWLIETANTPPVEDDDNIQLIAVCK